MNQSLKIIVWVIAAMMGVMVNIAAAEDVRETVMDEIVITGTKSEKKIEESPVSVSVVKSEEIEEMAVLTPEEILQYSPGTFHWKRTSINEPHPFVLMRGFRGSNRNLTLMDGMTINYPPSLTTNWMSVPMMTVERIEEVRGPFSSLYGGSAMGGVVNFITKTPEKQEIRAKVSYGTFDTLIAQAAYGDRFMDKFSLLLSYEGRRTDGYPSRIVKGSSTSGKGTTPVTGWQATRDVLDTKDIYILGDRGDEDNNENNIFAKLSFDITAKSNLSFSINHYEKDFEFGDYNTYLRDAYGNPVDSGSVSFLNQKIDVTPGTFLMGTGNSSRKQTRYIAKYTNKFAEGSSLEILLGANDTPESVSNSPGSSILTADGVGRVSETDSQAYFSEIKLNFPIGNRNFITSGVSYEQMSSEDMYHTLSNWKDTDSKTAFEQSAKGKTENIGIYIQDEISIFNDLTAYLGARYDLYRVSDGEVIIPTTILFIEPVPFSFYGINKLHDFFVVYL